VVGEGGALLRTWAITRRFGVFLEFSSVGRFIFCHLLYILSKFYHVGRGVLSQARLFAVRWGSLVNQPLPERVAGLREEAGWLCCGPRGGGCYTGVHKSYAMHKSTTAHVTDPLGPLGPPVLPVITKPGRCTYIPMSSPAEFIPKNFSWLCSPESNDKKESALTEEDLEITSWSSPVQLFKPKKSVSTYLHRTCPYTHYP
jgi:hypothetical protein